MTIGITRLGDKYSYKRAREIPGRDAKKGLRSGTTMLDRSNFQEEMRPRWSKKNLALDDGTMLKNGTHQRQSRKLSAAETDSVV